MRRLGWETVPCFVFEGTERQAKIWEIVENLHRAELTVLQRSEQEDDLLKLLKLEDADKLAQVEPVSAVGGRGVTGGLSDAARELGIDRREAQRAAKIAGLSDEAKAVAVATGLDDNQSAMLAVAKVDKAGQAEALREIAQRKAEAVRDRAEQRIISRHSGQSMT